MARRTPHGVRGLKWQEMRIASKGVPSHPSRGAWIEMSNHASRSASSRSHPSRGAWIEIYRHEIRRRYTCRTPHGVRGLKFEGLVLRHHREASHPSRGAWIEIRRVLQSGVTPPSHPSRGAWIEITQSTGIPIKKRSHPSRGAWIEMGSTWHATATTARTPHGVRGLKWDRRGTLRQRPLAPLTGCVD